MWKTFPRKKIFLPSYALHDILKCRLWIATSFWSVPENFKSSVIFGEGYNVHKLQTNTLLVIVSEPLHVSISSEKNRNKDFSGKVKFHHQSKIDCSAFIGNTILQADPSKTETHDNWQSVSVSCCETFENPQLS